MKEKNLSLARKILLALLAVLVAVGAFFGVITMNRNGVGNTVEGALSASAAEEPDLNTKEGLKTAVDNLCKKLSDENESPRVKQLLTDAAMKLKTDIEAAPEALLNVYQQRYEHTLNLALQKGLAIEDLVSAYNAVTGEEITFQKDNIFTIENDAEDPDPLLTTLQTAVDDLKKSETILRGDHATTVDETLKKAVLAILGENVAWTADDSKAVKDYIEKVKTSVEHAAPAAGDNETRTDYLTPVKESGEAKVPVASALETIRQGELDAAKTQYNKICALLGETAGTFELGKDDEQKTLPTNCKNVNDALKAALAAVLTPATEEGDAPATKTQLQEHYATLMTTLGDLIDAADVAGTRAVPVLYTAALTAEQTRLAAAKTAAVTAFEGYYKELKDTDKVPETDSQYTELKTTLNGTEESETDGITLSEGECINNKLADVNTALKTAVLGVLDTLVLTKQVETQSTIIDSQAVQDYITEIKGLVEEAAKTITDDLNGLSDYENLQAAEEGKPDSAVTLNTVKAKLEEMRTAEFTAAKNAYKAYWQLLKGSEYSGNPTVDSLFEGVTAGDIVAINTKLADAVKELVKSLLTVVEGKNHDSTDFAGIISDYTLASEQSACKIDQALNTANEVHNALVETLGSVTDGKLGEGLITELNGLLEGQKTSELVAAKSAVVKAYNLLFGTHYVEYSEELEADEAENTVLKTQLASISGKTLYDLNTQVATAVKSLIGTATTDVTGLDDGVATPAEGLVDTALTTANEFSDSKTNPATIVLADSIFTTVKNAVDLQNAKNNATEALTSLNTTITSGAYNTYLEGSETEGDKKDFNDAFTTATNAIKEVAIAEGGIEAALAAVRNALTTGIDGMLTAASKAIATVEYKESYKALYNKDPDDLETFQEALAAALAANKELNTFLSEQIMALIEACKGEEAGAHAEAVAVALLEALGSAATKEATEEEPANVNLQIKDYSVTLDGGYAKFQLAKGQDDGFAALDTSLGTLKTSFETRMSAGDWTNLSGDVLTAAKAVINAVKLEKGDLTWDEAWEAAQKALNAAKTGAEDMLKIAAWKSVAKQEFSDSMSKAGVSGNLEGFMKSLDSIESPVTTDKINVALKDGIIQALNDALEDDSQAVKDKVNEVETAFKSASADEDDILDISANEALTTFEEAVRNQRSTEKESALAAYDAYYKAIKNAEAVPENDHDRSLINEGGTFTQLKGKLYDGVKNLFDGLETDHGNFSKAVKDKITEAKDEALKAITDSTATFPSEVSAKTKTLLSDIDKQFADEKKAAAKALKGFYKQLTEGLYEEEELSEQDTQLKAALESKLHEYINTAEDDVLKEPDEALSWKAEERDFAELYENFEIALKALLDEYTKNDTGNAAIAPIVTQIKEYITNYFAPQAGEPATATRLTDQPEDLSEKLKAFGAEANAKIRLERERKTDLDNLQAKFNALNVDENGRISDYAKEKLNALHATDAVGAINAIEYGEVGLTAEAWAAAYSEKSGALSGKYKGYIPDEGLNAFENALNVWVATNEYAEAYNLLKGTPLTDTEAQTWYDTNSRKDVSGLNNTLKTDICKLVDEYGNNGSDTSEVQAAVDAGKVQINSEVAESGIVELTSIVEGIVDAIDAKRTEEKNTVLAAYISAFNRITGNNVTSGEDDLVKEAYGRISGKTTFAEALAQLEEEITALLAEQEGDSKTVKDYFTAAKTAVADAFDAAPNALPDLTEALKVGKGDEAKDFHVAVSAQRLAEKAAAVAEYKAAYKHFNNADCDETTDDAIKAINNAANTVAANAELIKGIQGLLINYTKDLTKTDEIQEVLDQYNGKDEENIGEFAQVVAGDNGISEFINVPEEGAATGKVVDAKTAIDTELKAELDAAINAYKAAYKAITGSDVPVDDDGNVTDETAKADIDAIKDAATTDAKNDTLKSKVYALLATLISYDDEKQPNDAKEVIDYLTTQGTDTAHAAIQGVEPGEYGISDLTTVINSIKNHVTELRNGERDAAVEQYVAIYNLLTDSQFTQSGGTVQGTGENQSALQNSVTAIRNAGSYATDFNAELKTQVKNLLAKYVDANTDSLEVQDTSKYAADINGVDADEVTGISKLIDVAEDGTKSGVVADAKKGIDDARAQEILDVKNAYLAVVNVFAGTAYTLKADGTLDLETDDETAFLATAINAIGGEGNTTKDAIEALKTHIAIFLTTYFNDKDSATVTGYLSQLSTALGTAIKNENNNREVPKFEGTFALTLDFGTGETKEEIRTFEAAVDKFEKLVEADNATVQTNFATALKALTGLEVTDLTEELQEEYGKIFTESKTLVEANTAAATLMKKVVAAYVQHTKTTGEGQDAKVEILDSAAYTEIVTPLPGDIDTAKNTANTHNEEKSVDVLDLTGLVTDVKESLDARWNAEVASATASYLYVYNEMNNLSGDKAVTATSDEVKDVIAEIKAKENAFELNNYVFDQIKGLLDALVEHESQNAKAYIALVKGTPAVAATDDAEAKLATGLEALFAETTSNSDSTRRTVINWNANTTFTVGEAEDQTFKNVHDKLQAHRLATRVEAVKEYIEAYNAANGLSDKYTVTTDEKGAVTVAREDTTKAAASIPTDIQTFVDGINAKTTADAEAINTELKKAVKDLIGAFAVKDDSDAVTALMKENQGKVDDAETYPVTEYGVSDFTIYDDNKPSGNLVSDAKKAIETERSAKLDEVVQAYLDAYKAVMGGDDVAETDKAVKDACEAIRATETFTAALAALQTEIDKLIDSAKIVGDSTKVEGYFTAVKAAVQKVFDDNTKQEVPAKELAAALQIEGKDLSEVLSTQRDAEKETAVAEYKAAYQFFTGEDCADTDNVVKTINGAKSTTAANAELVKGVKDLLAAYVDTKVDSKKAQDLVTEHKAKIDEEVTNKPQENGITDLIKVAEDGTASGVLASAKEAIDNERTAERAEAVAQFKAAYKAITDKVYTETEGDVVSKINATTNATDANKLLVDEVIKLLQDNDLSEGDSNTVRAYLAANGDAITLFMGAAADNGISVLTTESGESPLKTAQARILALRTADITDAKLTFQSAYKLLMGEDNQDDTNAMFDDAAANRADVTIQDAKFALEILKDVLSNAIATKVMHAGDSAAVKTYLTSVKEAVEAYLDLAIEEISENAIPTLTGDDADPLTVGDEEVTLAEIKATLDEMRAEERAEAQETYKEYYKVVKGAEYEEATASDAEKKVLTDLAAASDMAAINNLLKTAVDALIDGYLTKEDAATTVGVVATAQKDALDDKFDAATEEGVLAEELAKDIARALDEIDFRRHQDVTIAQLNEKYAALAQDRMEAGAKKELETLKTNATDALNNAELGEKAIVAANADLDDMLTDALDSIYRKEAEGIAKQEYFDSYKALTGKDADATDATVKAALDAIAEAAKASTDYVSVVNVALKNAVNAVLDSLLLRDDRNVLIDSQDAKAVVEAAKKNVEKLTQNTKEVPEISDTLTEITKNLEDIREAKKAEASEAVDSVVESVTGDKTYPTDVQKQIDDLVAAAKEQIGGADYAGTVLIRNKLAAQIELIDTLQAYAEKATAEGVAIDSVKAIINAAIEEIGAAKGAAAVEKAQKAAILNANKSYTKLYLGKLVSAEKDTVKAVLTGPDGFNAKVEGASSAEEIEAIIEEAKIAIESVKFVDAHEILRKAFGSITADDEVALKDALNAFNGLKNTDVKDYLNKTSAYSSLSMQIADMLNKAAFEAEKSETVAKARALAEGKDGNFIAEMLERQLHNINDIWYEAHYNDDDRDAYLKQLKDALAAELTASDDVIKHAEKVQDTSDKMKDALNEYLTSGVYSGETAKNLKSIIDKYVEQAENVSTGGSVEESLQEIYNQAIAELNSAPTWAVTSGEISANGTTNDYEENYEGTTLWGYVTNDSGIEGGVTLSIETKDSTVTMETIQNGTLKAAAGSNLTEEEMKAIVDNKEVVSTLDISLLKQNVKVDAFNGLYKVTVLLPEALRDVNELEVVYVNGNGEVEVYNAEVSEDGKYLTFTTEHFSEFVLLGEATVNLWWLVITLTVVLGLELVALLVVLLKKGGKKNEKVASVLPLGLLLAVLPMNATGICVMLGVGVVALGVGIFFAARHKKSQK